MRVIIDFRFPRSDGNRDASHTVQCFQFVLDCLQEVTPCIHSDQSVSGAFTGNGSEDCPNTYFHPLGVRTYVSLNQNL
jgi:hypothetical protein